jgi:hypothetical protein
MNTHQARQQWFMVKNPDALLSHPDAIDLIRRRADKVRVFEDLEGQSALLFASKHTRRFVLFSELTDAQINAELPEAWRREHHQQDLFRDATLAVANDEHCPAQASSPNPPRFWKRVAEIAFIAGLVLAAIYLSQRHTL